MHVTSAARALAAGLAVAALAVLEAGGVGQAPAPTRDYPVQPVPFTAVTLTDDFWAPRMR